jgi:hypothetical protein
MRDKGMICDEDWTYAGGVATLVGLQITCPECSSAIHIGRAIKVGYGPTAIEHLMRVNGIDLIGAKRLVDEAFAEWTEQSRFAWTVAVSPSLLSRYPALSILSGKVGLPGDGGDRVLSAGL